MRVARTFDEICGLEAPPPNLGSRLGIVGALCTTHMSINTPRTNLAQYHNRRHSARFSRPSYSVSMQMAVDTDGYFTDVCLCMPGSMSDEDVLRSSSIYARGQQGSLAGTRLVGPRSYPLLDWLTVPYPPTDPPLWSHQVGGGLR